MISFRRFISLLTKHCLFLMFFCYTFCSCAMEPQYSPINNKKDPGWQRCAAKPRIANSMESSYAIEVLERYLAKFDSQDPSTIPKTDLSFIPALAREESRGQRVLILDSFFVPSSALLRYKNRVLGFYKLEQPNGMVSYEKYFPEITVYQPLAEISNYLASLSVHIPAHRLNDINIVNRPIRKTLKTPGFLAHGIPIFEWLADLLPEAQFVIADLPFQLTGRDFLCNPSQMDFNAMQKKFDDSFTQLKDIIARHGINLINMSQAPTPSSLARYLNTACGGKTLSTEIRNKILAIENSFFERMSTIPEVIVFQSLPNDEPTLYQDPKEDNRLVTKKYDNIIKVGYFAKGDCDFDESGIFDQTYLSYEQSQLVNFADLYINGGFTENGEDPLTGIPHPPIIKHSNQLMHRTMGLGASIPVGRMATSWATPLALAHFVYLKNMCGPKTAGEYRAFLKTGKGLPKMIDPLRFFQFELYVH